MPSSDQTASEDSARPYAYRTGRVEFFYLPFRSDERALIPRLETESLVREALDVLRSWDFSTVVDVGTGSGVIASAIAWNRPDIRTIAVDAYPRPLSLARENAEALGVRIEFFQSDLLSGVSDAQLLRGGSVSDEWSDGQFREGSPNSDGILFVANLPYVREGADDLSEDTALEPPEALFGGPKTGFELTLRFLKEVEAFVSRNPRVPVAVACEVGDDHSEEIAAAGRILGREIRTFPDLRGIHRFFTYSVWPS